MVRLRTAALKEGMITAAPVIAQGRTLLAAGVTVTRKHMRIFKTWGVTHVMVEGDAPDYEGENTLDMNSREVRTIKTEIEKRFSRNDEGNEIIACLKEIAFKKAIEESMQNISGSV
ncbi:MAG: hypothetical protein GF401_19035 [Chitinivibrionales bacterium]|nr:hypothetical protein [Chitinivibrionales bacterium]